MALLETLHLQKDFSGVTALGDFSFSVEKGEVHALVGENGAGKSTLVNLISGVYRPTSGELRIGGHVMDFRSPHDAGPFVGIVHQDRELVQHFSGCDSLFLGSELQCCGFLEKKAMKRAACEFMRRYDLDLDLDAPVSSLSSGRQQMLSILKVLFRDPEIIIFDEPTAPLSVKECETLFALIADLKKRGKTILYISHHLTEVLRIADRVTVMRNGRKVSTKPCADLSEDDLIRLMISRELSNQYPKLETSIGADVFVCRDYKSLRSGVRAADFHIRSGEIVGFAGLIGAGRSELAKAVFTGARAERGELLLDGRPFHSSSARDSIDKGLVMIPENRRDEGLITDMSVLDNLSFPQLKLWTRLGFVNAGAARRASREIVDRYSIKTWGLPQLVRTLSGGNQQKVSIGKWDSASARLWIFDEPTQGIDVDAKTEIYGIMGRLAQKGAGVWFISSEIRELMAIADRIYVMKDRRTVAEHLRPFNSEAILSDMMRSTAAAV